MNKAAILIGLFFVLGSLDIVRGQIALSTYFCETAITTSASITKACRQCSEVFVTRVFSSDRRLLPYTYTYCSDDGTFSLEVGINPSDFRTSFSYTCGDNLFVALDTTKTTLAAEFFISCADTMIYKCPAYQVFDQATAKCVPRTTTLTSGLPCTRTCGVDITKVGLSGAFCESKVYSTIKPICTTCATPFVEQIITENSQAVPAFYTFCAENGRFSLDIVAGYEPKTFFTPYCTGTNPLLPLDATKTSLASKAFWDCRIGLIVCKNNNIFDPVTNNCVANTGGTLPDGLSTCTKTCPATYAPYAAPYTAGPSTYYPPSPYASVYTPQAYGK